VFFVFLGFWELFFEEWFDLSRFCKKAATKRNGLKE